MAFPAPDPEFLGLLPGRGASVRPVGSRGCRRASGESPLRAQHRRPRLLLPPRPQSWVPATTSPRLGQLHRDPRSSWNPGWLWGAPYWPWPNPTPGTMRSQGPRGTCPRLQGVSRDPPQVRWPPAPCCPEHPGPAPPEARSVCTAHPLPAPSVARPSKQQGRAGGTRGGGRHQSVGRLRPPGLPSPTLRAAPLPGLASSALGTSRHIAPVVTLGDQEPGVGAPLIRTCSTVGQRRLPRGTQCTLSMTPGEGRSAPQPILQMRTWRLCGAEDLGSRVWWSWGQGAQCPPSARTLSGHRQLSPHCGHRRQKAQ